MLVIFSVGGILVRIHDFGKYPADINCDESMTAVEAMALVENGTDHLGNSYPVYFDAWQRAQQNALYGYILAGFIKIFGISTIVVRLPMLFFSLLGIAALTWIAYMLFSKEIALFCLIFIAINPWHIMLSRWGLESNIFPHFLILGLAFLCFSIKKGHTISLIAAMFFYGFSMYGYGVAFSFLPLFLLPVFIVLWHAKTFRFPTLLLALLCFFAVSWPMLLIIPVNYFKIPTIAIGPITIPLFDRTTRMSDILFFSENFSAQFLGNIQYLWNMVVLQKMDVWWNQLPTVGTYYKISLPFLLTGLGRIVLFIKKEIKQRGWTPAAVCTMILLINFIASLITGLVINDVNVTRMNHIYYPIILVTAYGIYWVCTKTKLMRAVIPICYGVYFVFFCYRYFYSEDRTFIEYTFDKGLEKSLQQAFEIPGKICISTYQYRNDFPITEINTIYLLKLPYRYYTGQMDEKDLLSSGYMEPYRDRFHYFDNLEAAYAENGENCTYLVNVRERDFFDQAAFRVSSHDFFSVAIPQSLNEE